MLLENCLTELGKYRKNEVVVACESSSHVWNSVSNNQNLDIYFEDCMGKGSSLGLGIALAKPTNKVIVNITNGNIERRDLLDLVSVSILKYSAFSARCLSFLS